MSDVKIIPTAEELWDDALEGINKRTGTPEIQIISLPKLSHNLFGLKRKDFIVLAGRPSNGKCLGKGTKILMFDGSVKPIEEIKIGEFVMGINSQKRKILSITNGVGELFLIKQKKGIDYIVNKDHILSLKKTGNTTRYGKYSKGKIVNLSVDEYLTKSRKFKHQHKGYKVGVEFPKQFLEIEPYFLGLWLGDGNKNNQGITSADIEIEEYLYGYSKRLNMKLSKNKEKGKNCFRYLIARDITRDKNKKCQFENCNKQGNIVQGLCKKHYIQYFRSNNFKKITLTNSLKDMLKQANLLCNKHIPKKYLFNSRKNRLELLAGLLDSDGSRNGRSGFEFGNINKKLCDDVCFLAKSLGFYSNITHRISKIKSINYSCISYRVFIGGNVEKIPIKIKRKKSKNPLLRDSLMYGITVKKQGMGEYYGFELDGDGLFLLEDFTVTHNSALSLQIAWDVAKQGFQVYFFSREMSQEALIERLFCNLAMVNNRDMLYKPMDFKDKFDEFRELIKNIKFIITDSIGVNIDNLYQAIEDLPQADMIVLDYIQTVRGFGRRREVLDDYIYKFKEICNEKNMVGLMVSQINRGSEQTEGKRPQLYQLKETGALEECADCVLLVFWEHYYDVTKPFNDYEITIAKQRNGATGLLRVKFYPQHYRFEEFEKNKEVEKVKEIFNGKECEIHSW